MYFIMKVLNCKETVSKLHHTVCPILNRKSNTNYRIVPPSNWYLLSPSIESVLRFMPRPYQVMCSWIASMGQLTDYRPVQSVLSNTRKRVELHGKCIWERAMEYVRCSCRFARLYPRRHWGSWLSVQSTHLTLFMKQVHVMTAMK